MKKALIVGLNNYPSCNLHWCDNDAIAIASLMEANGDGSPNFDVKQIIDTCTKARSCSSPDMAQIRMEVTLSQPILTHPATV